MMRRLSGSAGRMLARTLLLLASLAATVAAQEAVTITGHVSAANMPIQGASVRIEQLDLGTTTNVEGRYSFIVPSSRVRGQTVTLTTRYLRYRPISVQITLVGGSLVQDFDLRPSDETPAKPPVAGETPRPTAPVPGVTAPPRPKDERGPVATSAPIAARYLPVAPLLNAPTVDSSAFTDLAGTVDLPTALAGRLAGVEIQSGSVIGGSSSILVRGPRTIVGSAQPLVVVNGIITASAALTTAAQRSGRGGFDYGSAINDLNLEDIATVQLLRGPLAAAQYGGRAANGVLLVTTRSARGLNGFAISASQQLSNEQPLRLPSYQNAYGQGLGGKFSFFNGKGGGVNDSTDQSWGPALAGQPVPQASLTEAGRADVRPFVPVPGNVRDFFQNGRTLTTNVGAQGANESSQFRLSVSTRSSTGLVPATNISRQTATLTGATRPSPQLTLAGDLQYYGTTGTDRPGTGFDESNPVSLFAHLPRQVDVATLRTRLRDLAGNAISWNYAGHNNPYFAVLENHNKDDRTHLLGGASVAYAFSSVLSGSARIGADHASGTRSFTVGSGWQGGFPYYAGRGSFATGGFQNDDITTSNTNVDVALRATPATTSDVALAFTVGAGRRSDDLHTITNAAVQLPNTSPAGAADYSTSSSTNYLLAGAELGLRDAASVSVQARGESSSLLSSASSSTVYPSIMGSLDFARLNPSMRQGGHIDVLSVRAGWSRSGNDATASFAQQVGGPLVPSGASLALLAAPEVTSGFEAGTDVRMYDSRLLLGLSAYSDVTDDVIVPAGSSFTRGGSISNKGIDASILLVPLRTVTGFEWNVGVTYGKNSSVVESLGGASSVTLSDPTQVVTVQALPGASLGALVGTRYLRNGSGQLLLNNGRPLADSLGGRKLLGESAPSWTGGLSSMLRLRGVEFSVLFDTHRGGQIYSASNRAGAVSGTLAETASRPDSGLLISGIDVATGAANAKHVSTEDFYRALGAIGERWLYDASFVKLREARASFTLPLRVLGILQAQSIRASIIGRNLALWTDAPNIDPETVLSTSSFRGAELGQLPTARSVGFQITLTP